MGKADTPDKIGQRIRRILGQESVLGFAERAGINGSTLQKVISLGRIPRADLVEKVVRATGVNAQWLLTGEGSEEMEHPVIEIVGPEEVGQCTSEFVAVPLLDDAVAAGEPREVREAHQEGWGIVHRNWIPHPAASVMVRVKGDSMEPTIPDGSLVVVDTSETEPGLLVRRAVLIIKHGGGATVKRLHRGERESWVGIPDNLTADNQPISLDFRDGDRIAGRIRSVHAKVE